MTLVRAAQLPAFGVLASLLIVAGPDAGMMTVAACLAIAALTTVTTGRGLHFALPGWVFRGLALPSQTPARSQVLARAWWIQPEG